MNGKIEVWSFEEENCCLPYFVAQIVFLVQYSVTFIFAENNVTVCNYVFVDNNWFYLF